MRRFQIEYESENSFARELSKLKQWTKRQIAHEILFQIYAEIEDNKNKTLIDEVIKGIEKFFPEANYVGCSTNGNIVSGDLGKKTIAVICNIFEYPDTTVRVFQLPMNQENEAETVGRLKNYIDANRWVKSVELLTTINGMSMTEFCEVMAECRKDVCIYGGGAFPTNFARDDSFVFSKENDYSDSAVIFLLIGGDEFHVVTMHITGWQPLGREMLVTKTEDNRLCELDGKPAFDIYNKYLNIKNDASFFDNALEFPIFFERNGVDLLRAPTHSNPDGSITLSSAIKEGMRARLAYGDPEVILDSIKEDSMAVAVFMPEVIDVFSCAARRSYWGDRDVGGETMPFEAIASTAGFFTSGEFLRTDKYMNLHNVTLVVAAMREGDVDPDRDIYYIPSEESKSGKINMIKRFTTFINATTEEMEEAYKKLAEAAITDAMTGLLNRGEIQRRITDELENGEGRDYPISLIMMDLDDFKKVNDTYGHHEGDQVLKGLADVLRKNVGESRIPAEIGRWGGEEFMILLRETDEETARKLAERLRTDFYEVSFEKAGHVSMTLGVTQYKPGESADTVTMRVDKALYAAKANGKNRVAVG
ncbi:MAG: diguanylate cyclase [Lachnospiraceae bacterium]|nr:diguanylate cyclase [Lachnospiraceae bacterium]